MALKSFEKRLYIKLGKDRADEVLKKMADAKIDALKEEEAK